jgi:hypothetical protein
MKTRGTQMGLNRDLGNFYDRWTWGKGEQSLVWGA